jgi:hypothetical protein
VEQPEVQRLLTEIAERGLLSHANSLAGVCLNNIMVFIWEVYTPGAPRAKAERGAGGEPPERALIAREDGEPDRNEAMPSAAAPAKAEIKKPRLSVGLSSSDSVQTFRSLTSGCYHRRYHRGNHRRRQCGACPWRC